MNHDYAKAKLQGHKGTRRGREFEKAQQIATAYSQTLNYFDALKKRVRDALTSEDLNRENLTDSQRAEAEGIFKKLSRITRRLKELKSRLIIVRDEFVEGSLKTVKAHSKQIVGQLNYLTKQAAKVVKKTSLKIRATPVDKRQSIASRGMALPVLIFMAVTSINHPYAFDKEFRMGGGGHEITALFGQEVAGPILKAPPRGVGGPMPCDKFGGILDLFKKLHELGNKIAKDLMKDEKGMAFKISDTQESKEVRTAYFVTPGGDSEI